MTSLNRSTQLITSSPTDTSVSTLVLMKKMSMEATLKYLEEPEDDLKCSICLCAFIDPLFHDDDDCGNIFCRECISTLKSCPLCRKPTTGENWHKPPRYVVNKLNSLKVECPSCNTPISRGDLNNHVMRCEVECEQVGCGQKVKPIDMADHLMLYCPEVTVPCPAESYGCDQICLRRLLPRHEKKCPYVTLKPTLQSLTDRLSFFQQATSGITEQIVILSGWSTRREKFYSDFFVIQGRLWRLLIFPQGNSTPTKCVSLYLQGEHAIKDSRKAVKVQFTLRLMHFEDQKSIEGTTKYTFREGECSWGYHNFCAREVLDKVGYVCNDEIRIKVRFTEFELL